MARCAPGGSRDYHRVPHARGDGPCVLYGGIVSLMCSPRPWGWPVLSEKIKFLAFVFPTPVGMARYTNGEITFTASVPHAPWGWPVTSTKAYKKTAVFPTPVGMARLNKFSYFFNICVPHARGDGPTLLGSISRHLECSPRPWGWPVTSTKAYKKTAVFPTPVGMAREIFCPRT